MPRQVVVIARDNTYCGNVFENDRQEEPVKFTTVSANPWQVMSRKFLNALKIAQKYTFGFDRKVFTLKRKQGKLMFFRQDI